MEVPVKQKLPLKKSKIGFPNLKNMKQHPPHIEMIKKVARRLGALRPKVVFLGGSSTGFHITDKAAPEVRATKDVDIIVEVASRVEYHQLENTLRELGFFQKIIADDPICRWYISKRKKHHTVNAQKRKKPRHSRLQAGKKVELSTPVSD